MGAETLIAILLVSIAAFWVYRLFLGVYNAGEQHPTVIIYEAAGTDCSFPACGYRSGCCRLG